MRQIATCLLVTLAMGLQAQGPEVSAKAAILMDAESGTVIFERSAHALRQPASTTKIITGLLALEKIPAGTMISAPAAIEKVGESSLHLKPGETLTREDALFALLLRSANDMAHTLAVHIAGSDAAFAKLMNERAAAIGCKNTSFVNPHGLPNDKHLTTAYDLALIAREAMKNDFFRKIVGTHKWFVMRSANQKDLLVENTNRLLIEDAYIEGVKTGYTRAAGRCFVGSRNENGLRLISVVLGSDDWAKDTKNLFAWGFSDIQLRARYSKAQVIGKVPIEGGLEETANVRTNGAFAVFSPATSPPLIISYKRITAPVTAGSFAGSLQFVDASGKLTEYPLVFSQDVPAKPLILALTGNWITWAVLGTFAISLGAFRGRRQRSRPRRQVHAR